MHFYLIYYSFKFCVCPQIISIKPKNIYLSKTFFLFLSQKSILYNVPSKNCYKIDDI